MAKHILIPCQYFYPEQFRINDMAFEWVKRGYKVTVVTGIPNYPEGKFYPGYSLKENRRETVNGVDIIRIPLIPRGHNKLGLVLNYFSFPFFGYFWAKHTDIRADIVFMFETSPMNQLKVGVRYAKRMGIPAFAYIQDLWPENVQVVGGINSPLVIRPIERMVKKIYAGCSYIFATSPKFVESIQQRVPADDKEKVRYWPQYAEDFYEPKPTVPHDKFRIIFTGNIGQAQGLELLPKAAAYLRTRGNLDIEFIIVGDGRDRANFERSIQMAGVGSMFKLVGRVPATEIPDIMATADVAFLSFKSNALWEQTIPAKLQSYMACGMPVLAAATGETARILKEADCGITSPNGDELALAANILKLKKAGPERLREMGRNALRYKRNNFDKKTLMDEMDKYLGGPNS